MHIPQSTTGAPCARCNGPLMSRRTTQLLKAALSAMYYSGADGLVAPFTRGDGVIFMLHRVTPEPVREFEPNRILKVTPDFLDAVIRHVVEAGFDILALDEVPERVADPRPQRPFACFTLDDGYRDNLQHALPVFRRNGVPFTVYVPGDYPDGRGDLWWLMLEQVIADSCSIEVEIDGQLRRLAAGTVEEKERAYDEIYWALRTMPECEARELVDRQARRLGLDRGDLCRSYVMSWDEVRQMARDPLVTIGAHTCRHMALSRLDAEAAEREMADSIARIEAELGRPCRHFSYPYGCAASAGEREFALARKLGLATAVTTSKGLIERSGATALTALPRFSLNGDFQDLRYLKVMLSGAPFRLWQAFGRAGMAGM